MPRFFIPVRLQVGAVVALPDHVAHHIHVLRLGEGDAVTLFNGEGGEFHASLAQLSRRHASAEIEAFSPREAELPYGVTLVQALPEGTKMDWIVEKAVELGAAAIQPLAARRCVVRLSAERGARKLDHWRAIMAAAAEQCGRNRLPQLGEPLPFSDWVGQHDLHRRILLTPRATESLASWARHQAPQAVALMIGPEGGFSEEEEDLALGRGALPLTMGPRVLRTETAGMAALAVLNGAWGEC